mmetsp:Transcript_39766/g.52078  ORF Transcript_39766/g.52078 Transcript_39766/m.52078 type:complete len:89 (+) Transcript_39766:946-1212(+)
MMSPDHPVVFFPGDFMVERAYGIEVLGLVVALNVLEGEEADSAQIVHELGDDLLFAKGHVDGLERDHVRRVDDVLLVYAISADLLGHS